MTKYFIFQLRWSQTDHDTVIVEAENRSAAEAHLKQHGERGPRYVEFQGEVDKIIKIKN